MTYQTPLAYAAQITDRAGVVGTAWLAALPSTVEACCRQWGLTVEADTVRHGAVAVVVPVLRGREPLVLKVPFPGDEGYAEGAALASWAGDGTVRLHAEDPATGALLLERLDGARTLSAIGVDEGIGVISDLLRRLRTHTGVGIGLTTDAVADQLSTDLSRRPSASRCPEALLRVAVDLCATLRTGQRSLLHGDLHYDNVLAAGREPWLAIDPKGLLGDPAYEAMAPLWNRTEEIIGDFSSGVAARHLAICSAADLPPARAARWSVVRIVDELTSDWRGPGTSVDAAERAELIALADALLPLC